MSSSEKKQALRVKEGETKGKALWVAKGGRPEAWSRQSNATRATYEQNADSHPVEPKE